MAKCDLLFTVSKYIFISAIFIFIVRGSDWSGMEIVPKEDGIKLFSSGNRKIFLALRRISKDHVVGYPVKRVFAVSSVSRTMLVILFCLHFHCYLRIFRHGEECLLFEVRMCLLCFLFPLCMDRRKEDDDSFSVYCVT